MNDRQNAKLSMYNVVVNYLNANAAIIAGVPAFETAFNGFKTKATAIVATGEQQQMITEGVTLDKNAGRDNLRNLTVDIASLVYAFATAGNNIVLQEQTNLTQSKLKILKDDQLAARSQTVHDAANTNLAALADYGVTAALLTTLQTAIDNYNQKSPAPRTAISQKTALTTQLKQLFKEADDILNKQMDKTAVKFKADNPDFYNTYIASRGIVDAPKPQKQAPPPAQ